MSQPLRVHATLARDCKMVDSDKNFASLGVTVNSSLNTRQDSVLS